MMNIKKSGRAGKAKTALALSAALVFSLVFMQCNSKADEQELLTAQASNTQEPSTDIHFPVLPKSPYKFELSSLENTIHLDIDGGKIYLNGEIV